MGKQFLIMIAAKAGQLLDTNGSNFYFHIIDYEKQDDRALYYMGRQVEPPAMPQPTTWSISRPSIVVPPKELGATEWAGTAIFSETNKDRVVSTYIMLIPTVLGGKIVRFGIHAHLNTAQAGESRSSFSTDFTLRQAGY